MLWLAGGLQRRQAVIIAGGAVLHKANSRGLSQLRAVDLSSFYAVPTNAWCLIYECGSAASLAFSSFAKHFV